MKQLAEARLEPSKVVSRDGSGKLDSVRTRQGLSRSLPLQWDYSTGACHLSQAACQRACATAAPTAAANRGCLLGSLYPCPLRSSGTFLTKRQDSVVAGVEDRIELATHLPFSHSEQLQVLKWVGAATGGGKELTRGACRIR